MFEIYFPNNDSPKHPENYPLMGLLIPQPTAIEKLTQYGILSDAGLSLEEVRSLYDYAFHTKTYATYPDVIADMVAEDLGKIAKADSFDKEILCQKLGLQIIGSIVILSPRIKIHQTACMLFLASQTANEMHTFEDMTDFQNTAQFLGYCLGRAKNYLTLTHPTSRALEIIQTVQSFFRDHLASDTDRLQFDRVFNEDKRNYAPPIQIIPQRYPLQPITVTLS